MNNYRHKQFSKIIIFLFIIIFYSLNNCLAQLLSAKGTETDVELWTGLDFTKEINKKLDLSFAFQTRLRENISIVRSNFAQIGLSFPLLKNSKKINLSTSLRVNRNEDAEWTVRPIVDFAYGAYKNNIIDIDYRIRLQKTFTNNLEENFTNFILFDELYWRNRITVKYLNIKDFTPFLGIALFKDVQRQSITPDQFRIITGFSHKINKRHNIKITYIYREKFNIKNQSTNHIISAKLYFEVKDFKKKRKKKATEEKKLDKSEIQQPSTSKPKKNTTQSKPLGPHRIEP